MAARTAIDCDFLGHLTDIQRYPDVCDLITRFFSALDIEPVVHPFVYDREMTPALNQAGRDLFQKEVIRRVEPAELWEGSDDQRNYYETMVKQLYKDFTGREYPCEMYTQWRAKQSLGEVHTAVMCAFLECGYFCSDDKEAGETLSRLLQNRMAFPVEILNRDACCESLKGKTPEERCGLTGDDLKKLSHK